MTTLEPGASVVFTQGLRARPASTAFLASSAAPTMTEGFEVLVHDVMAAITTDPWSTDVLVPSSSVTSTGADGRAARVVPQALLLGVGLDQGDPFGRPAGEPQVGEGLGVDGEDRAGGAELRAHVADRGPVRDRHRRDALAVELHELADHAVLAE